MDANPKDTTVEAAVEQVRILREMGIEGRAAMTFQLSDNLHKTIEAGVRHRHPDFDDRAVRLAVLRLKIGDDLFKQVIKDIEKRI